jgi:hypothetical protein
MRVLAGSTGGIAPTISYLGTRGVSGQRDAPAALYRRGKDLRYPLDRRLGRPQSRSGCRDGGIRISVDQFVVCTD